MNEQNVFSPFDRSLLTCGKLRLSYLIGFKTSETIFKRIQTLVCCLGKGMILLVRLKHLKVKQKTNRQKYRLGQVIRRTLLQANYSQANKLQHHHKLHKKTLVKAKLQSFCFAPG